ncbi:MAG: ABC transporter ATP-binding protein [Firmicutes bacterium]|nr:ABC transporter ATP-binding protein [Bacillota bacterium]
MKLQVRDLRFSYQSEQVLDQIVLEVETGDFVSIVGPNGSGKSTLLRCIDGILKTKAGTVLIDGKNITAMSGTVLAQNIAYVPQSEGGGLPANVFETVLMGRKPYIAWSPGRDDLQKTAAVIEQLGLEELALRDINQLSGGQRQKVFIGRALAQDTGLILLDEPTANLDLKHQLEVLELLKAQTRKGIAVIAAIHDLNLAARYSNKVIMLREGAIFAAGGPEVLNQENIEHVYEVKVMIIKDKDRLIVVPEETAGEKVG